MKSIKHHKSILSRLLSLFSVGTLSIVPTFAAASTALVKQYMLDYNRYFVIDATRDGLFGMNPIADIANGLFTMHKWIMKLVAGLIELSYTFDLYNLIEKQFNIMFKPMKVTFFDGFFPIAGAIFVLALLFLFRVGGRASEALENFLKGMAILVFALWFMRNPADSMSHLKNLTDLVNGELIKNTTGSKGVDPKTQYRLIADQFYTTNVVEIWRILNFSSAGIDDPSSVNEISKKYEKQLLSQVPGSSEREETVKQLREEVPVNEGSILFTILLIMVLSLPDLVITLILSGINFASDGLTLLLALVAPIIFIFTLVPAYGSRLFMSWLSKILFFFGLTVATTILLSYYMSFSSILLSNQTALNGLIGVYFIKAVMIVTIYLFREKLKFAYSAMGHGRRGMERGVKEMGLEKEADMAKHFALRQTQTGYTASKKLVETQFEKVKNRFSTTPTSQSNVSASKGETQAFTDPVLMDQERRSALAEEMLEANLKKKIHVAKQKAVEMEDTFGIQFTPDYGKMAEKVAKYESGDDPFTGAERREMINDIYLMEKAGKDPVQLLERNKVKEPTRLNQDERRLHAQRILEDQLQARIAAAQLSAGEGEPQYDAYTTERLRRKEVGEEVFDDKEVKAVSDGIKKYEKNDQDSSRLVKRRTSHIEVSHKVKHKVEHEVEEHFEASNQENPGIKVASKPAQNEVPESSVDIKAVKQRTTGELSRRDLFKQDLEQKKELDELQEGIQDVKKALEDHGRGINDRLKKFEGADHEKE